MTEDNASKSQKLERLARETSLDFHIRKTKDSLSLRNVSVVSDKRKTSADYVPLEFGFSSGRPIGWYMYLVAKLVTLYLVKGSRWLIAKTRHALPDRADAPDR